MEGIVKRTQPGELAGSSRKGNLLQSTAERWSGCVSEGSVRIRHWWQIVTFLQSSGFRVDSDASLARRPARLLRRTSVLTQAALLQPRNPTGADEIPLALQVLDTAPLLPIVLTPYLCPFTFQPLNPADSFVKRLIPS